MPNRTFILLKTTPDHLTGVTETQKHALRGRIQRAKPGDVILVAEIQKAGPAVVRYAMFYASQHKDESDETLTIWGRHWPYIIEGRGGQWLDRAFAPAKLIPDGPYGQGGTLAYVPSSHAETFVREGLLSPLM